MSRLLTEEEVPKLVPLGRLFFAEAGCSGTFNPPHFVAWWRRTIRTCAGFVLVKDGVASQVDAALGAAIWDDPLTGERISAETFYYAHPDRRTAGNLRLLVDYEQTAMARGAKRVWMVHLNRPGFERIGEWYLRRGYSHRETLYEKKLS